MDSVTDRVRSLEECMGECQAFMAQAPLKAQVKDAPLDPSFEELAEVVG